MKKIIVTSLIPFLIIHLGGCKSFKDITIDEIKNNNEKIIELKTTNSKTYNFSSKGYEVKNDTLYGKFGLEIIDNDLSVPFKGIIPVKEIKSLKSKVNSLNEDLFYLGALAALFTVIVLLLVDINN